jgi:hypothetical protein
MIKSIEPLGKHNRAVFSCGVAALDDWFHLRTGQDEKRNMARIFVAINDQREIVGFYRLVTSHSPSPTCRPNMRNACRAMTLFQPRSYAVLRVMREFAAKESVVYYSLMRFGG